MANNPIAPVLNPDELPAMTAGELKCGREYLGLSTAWMAEKLVISERRIQRMETSQQAIPTPVITLMDEAWADAKALFEELHPVYRRKVKAGDGRPVILPTYRTDKESVDWEEKYPARFYRHIAARIADGCAGAIIMFYDQMPKDYDRNAEEPAATVRAAVAV
jgi:hypothetical protein